MKLVYIYIQIHFSSLTWVCLAILVDSALMFPSFCPKCRRCQKPDNYNCATALVVRSTWMHIAAVGRWLPHVVLVKRRCIVFGVALFRCFLHTKHTSSDIRFLFKFIFWYILMSFYVFFNLSQSVGLGVFSFFVLVHSVLNIYEHFSV